MDQAALQQIQSALQTFQADQQSAISQIKPLADSGDLAAVIVLAYMFGPMSGRWPEGVPYASRALEAGVTAVAFTYGQNLMNQGDPALRTQAVTFLDAASDDGWPFDPFGAIQQLAQQGDLNALNQLLDLAQQPRPNGARQRWEALIGEVEARRQDVEGAAAVVESARDQTLASIEEDRAAVSEQRASMEQLVTQVGALANKAAGGAIAEDYATRAEQVERTAARYTVASITFAVLIAVAATIATVVIDSGKLVDDAASKAAIAVPLVALNLYLVRLASQYRQEATQLRHIELQFNTANPFLGLLDEERRRSVLADLAPKFFPGQALPGGGNSEVGGAPAPDLNQLLIAALIDRKTANRDGSGPKNEAS